MFKLHDSKDAPKIMPLQLLSEITNNFSEDRKLGSGTYGEVFKGVHNGEAVAVKKLRQMPGSVDGLEFKKEFENLMRLSHENIVQLLGYCYETRHEYVVLDDGRAVFAENTYRAFCFEYMHNGSLQDHLYDEYHGLDWQTRYKIIMGICKGLRYLHEELESPIYHLDLKPDNILLDNAMVPKLADFGLSKLVHNDQTQATGSSIGTMGYLPPEYIDGNLVSKKFDIFSLGVVMIRIMTGYEGYHKKADMSSQEFIDLVCNNWRSRLQATQGCSSLKDECHQVKRCIEIALDCVKADRKQRPEIGAIIHQLNETGHLSDKLAINLPNEARHDTLSHVDKSMTVSAAPSPLQRIISVPKGLGDITPEIQFTEPSKASKLLGIHPLELHFPFEPNKVMECPVTMTNMTDHYVGVWITLTDQFTLTGLRSPGMIEPHTSLSVAMTVEQRELSSRDTDLFEVVMILLRTKKDFQIINSSIFSKLNVDINVWKIVEMLGAEVHRAMLSAVICDPTSCQPVMHNQFISTPLGFGEISCIDVHPTNTWTLVCQRGGCISILNYQTLIQHTEIVLQMQVPKTKHYIKHSSSERCNIRSAKFITGEEWFAVGDDDGCVHVYSYITKNKIIEVEAYHGEPVSCLAVHPTLPFLLTSSSGDNWIKLWDWGKGWKCIKKYDNADFPFCIQWNPWDATTFVGASIWGIKVWGFHSSDPVTILKRPHRAPCCFYSDNHQNFMVTSSCFDGYNGYMYGTTILGVQTNERVHQLAVANDQEITDFACHPTLPLLATISDKYFCLWNTSTYRLEKMVNFTDHPIVSCMVLSGTNNMARLVIANWNGISVMEISLTAS